MKNEVLLCVGGPFHGEQVGVQRGLRYFRVPQLKTLGTLGDNIAVTMPMSYVEYRRVEVGLDLAILVINE